MRKYTCKVVPLISAPRGAKGFLKPLCDKCTTKDCDNPIEFQTISHIGVNQKLRCYRSGNNVGIVLACEGFIQ